MESPRNLDPRLLMQFLGRSAEPAPPSRLSDLGGGQADADRFGYGPAPNQDWTPPEANRPGMGGMIDRGLTMGRQAMDAAPGQVEEALRAAEEAFNAVMQGAGEAGGRALEGGRELLDQGMGAGREFLRRFEGPPTLRRPQPGQSEQYPAPRRLPPFSFPPPADDDFDPGRQFTPERRQRGT